MKHILSGKFLDFPFLYHHARARTLKDEKRLLACHYLQNKKTISEVACILDVDRRTIITWMQKFEAAGLKSLLQDAPGRGRKAYLTEEDQKIIQAYIADHFKHNAQQKLNGECIQAFVKEKFGVHYGISGIYRLLARSGMPWLQQRQIQKDQQKIDNSMEK